MSTETPILETATAPRTDRTPANAPRTFDRILFALALATTAATFPMIFMGGLVTSNHAGMSVPDWPNSYGYNMFLFPPRLWVGGILYEHTHRLMGTVVGLLSVLLVTYAWGWLRVIRPRVGATPPVVRWVCMAVLLAVALQGAVGGLRVVLVSLHLAIVHACLAQAFFCLAAFCAIITSKWWTQLQHRTPLPRDRALIGLAVVSVAAIFLQLMVGATMRHFDAGLAIPGVLVYGHWLPPMSSAAMDAINRSRVWDSNLDPVTLGQVWLAFAHRAGAVVVTLLLLALVSHVFYHHRRQRVLVGWSVVTCLLIVLQLMLGVLTVYFRKPADVASSHVATGALVLVCTFTLMVCAMGLMPQAKLQPVEPAEIPATPNAPHGKVPAWS